MTVKSSNNYEELEADGETTLSLVAVTYTGSKSLYRDQAVIHQGRWPSFTAFSPGDTHVGLVPDEGLDWWETHNSFNIDYAPAAIAAAFLDSNFLPPQIFGDNVNPDLRDRVLDKFDMEYIPRNEEEIRRELAEIAGRDEDEEAEAVNEEMDFESELLEHERGDLKEAASELREDSDEISLNSGKTDFAEYLAGLVRDDEAERQDILSVIQDE